MRKHILLLIFGTSFLNANAQISRLGEDIEYKAELNGQFGSGDHTPFWQSANRYGLTSIDNNSGYLRVGIQRDTKADSLRHWRIGYGADLVLPVSYSSHFIVQQLYAEAQYKAVRLSVGQKERAAELKNPLLSSGGLAMGTNARPIPQVRIEVPEFYVFPKTKNWLGMKGHIAYGAYTDNRWQRDFNAGNTEAIYSQDSRYHSKAGFIRIGNVEKFPLVVTGGLEMVCQFGGKIWNTKLRDADGNIIPCYNQNGGVKDFFTAFFPSGSDVMDGPNPNINGNHIGAWHGRLDYHGKGWGASFYAEHFFEDHSQLGWDFSWKDMLYGVEINLPKNPIVSTLLYEHLRTTDQSGAVFRSYKTDYLPTAIGGADDYYNHGLYGAYQQAGFVLGNPLIISPIYNTNNMINCYDNRVTAHHIGVSGNPCDDLSYRILYTHERSLGNYKTPRTNPANGNALLVEATYKPHQIEGLGITASYGQNGGDLFGRSKGGMLTVSYSGWFNKTK